MNIEEKLIDSAMKINLEIVSFQQELYELNKQNLRDEELFEITEDINFIVGTLVVHHSAIGNMLSNIAHNKNYIEENKDFIVNFLTHLEEYFLTHNVGIR